MVDFNLRALAKRTNKPAEQPTADVADARHLSMMAAIAPYAKAADQRNTTPVYVDYKTRKTKMTLVLCPEWAPQFPPFNLARLSGIAKSAGYETTILDLNIRAHSKYQREWKPQGRFPFTLWDSAGSWHWLGETYMRDIHPVLEPLLSDAVDEIIAGAPDLVGFTLYYNNTEPSKWMCRELKRRCPSIQIAVGGSNVQQSWFTPEPCYDWVVKGEGEQAILDILDQVEQGVVLGQTRVMVQPGQQRININNLPLPDYESIDFDLYAIPNGVNSEISRGCTAKCTFCEETHFWKYRQRRAVDLITEVEWLYYNKGTTVIWFIDSLVNGNLNELRAFCKAVAAKGLEINWTGYARCDGRMDLEYFRDLRAGGCIMLNYGIESGSQRVLDDMDKGVTVAEMEQNFRHGKAVGIWAATNWIVGFPTEQLQDFADSMTFLWRMRDMNINNVGAGVGFGLGPETIAGQNPHRFNLSYQKYQGHWITQDFTKGGTHVMMRVKCFHIFLDHVVTCVTPKFGYPHRPSLARDHYKIVLDDPSFTGDIEYESFDYAIIEPHGTPWANSLVNEIWPLLRMLWLTRGGYSAEIRFDPDLDLTEFGSQFGPGGFKATYKFRITADGTWTADFNMRFAQVDNPFDDRLPRPAGRKGAFFAQDYSRMDSNTAQRARVLAKPDWGQLGRSDSDFNDLLAEEERLNDSIDFTFSHRYRDTGKWTRGQ